MTTLPVATSSTLARASGLAGWLQRHTLLAYVVLAFAFTWPFMLADMLGSWGVLPFRLSLSGPGLLLTLLMGFGPTWAALVVTGLAGGRSGLRALLGRLLLWRVGGRWYAVVLLGTFGLFGTAAALYALSGGALRAGPPLSVGLALMLAVSLVLHGLLNGEELGWRGVALPRLLGRASPLAASLILGAIWALFHLPLFFTRGGVGGGQADESMLAFAVQILASSVLVTWLYSHTRGSVLLAYLFHAAVNTWPDLFHAAVAGSALAWYQAGMFALAALVVVMASGPTRWLRAPTSEQ